MSQAAAEKHPSGLYTLFFTEMWERFSYYGMRALLILYMTAATAGANPGLELDTATAGAVYGLYTGMVYLLGLPGGWIADRIWGQRKAVFVGGCVIAAGHFSMAAPSTTTFFVGLALIAIGTGLLKPNVSSLVADLYPAKDARRDAGFSIFYMGINLGAFLGPLACGALGEDYNWHLGFSLAGFGMVLGVIQFRLSYDKLGDAGLLRNELSDEARRRLARRFFGGCAVAAAALVVAGVLAAGAVTLPQVADNLAGVILAVVVLYFVNIVFFGGHSRQERKQIAVVFWLCILATVFWSGFEQAGSSLNLFARDYTDRTIGDWTYKASWLQSVNSLFIIVLAPVFGSLWVWLATRKANPSVPLKFALGLLLLAAGFLVVSWGAANATPDEPASVSWLVVMYFLFTVGELILSPVGLSAVTKLAPANRVSQMMGLWFVATSLGNLIAGQVAGQLEGLAPSPLFKSVATIIGATGLVALLASPFVKRWSQER